MRSENLVQMLLFSSEIFAFARFTQSEQVAIKFQTSVGVRNPNRSVIDAEKQSVGLLLPARIAFARRKINDLQVVLVGIAKIERLNPGSGFDRRRQRLRTSRDELHFQRPQFFKCLIHVAHDDSDVLKPKIVAARICGNRPAGRSQILRQIEIFIPELHPHNPHPRAKHAFQMFEFVPQNLDIRNFLKRERRIKRHRSIHVAHRHSNGFNEIAAFARLMLSATIETAAGSALSVH